MLARGPDELEEEEESFTADPEGLRRFVETEVLQWFEKRKKELANRPLIRDQAFGEALDPNKLERLGRYEVHPRPQARKDAGHAAAPQGPAAGHGRGLIRFAKIGGTQGIRAETCAAEQGTFVTVWANFRGSCHGDRSRIAASARSNGTGTPTNPIWTKASRFSTSPATPNGCLRSKRREKNAACSTSRYRTALGRVAKL